MGSILGNRVERVEDPRMLTAGGTYVEDVVLPGSAWVTYVRSTHAHARITGIDLSEAKAVPGVLAVFTGEDVADLGLVAHTVPSLPPAMRRPFVAHEVVRYVGQAVVAIIAEDRAIGTDAADLVVVDYESLPVVIEPEAAQRDEEVLFPEVGTNVVARFASAAQADFSGCEVVVEERIANQRMTAAPLEGRSGAAYWTDDGRLVHYSACQGAHPPRDQLVEVYGLDASQVRVVVPDMGGGFGAKSRTYPEELALGYYARAVGRPVRWTETRSENMVAMAHGRAQTQTARMGGTRDGRITAYQLDVLQDAGAYPTIGAVLPTMTQRMTTGVYDLGNCRLLGRVRGDEHDLHARVPRRRPAGSRGRHRADGRPVLAAEIGMDPAEVRRRNLVPASWSRTPLESARCTTSATTRRRWSERCGPRTIERSAGRAGPPPRRRGSGVPRDRHRGVRRDHRRRRGPGVRRRRAAGRRPLAGALRGHPLRPGPRHDVGDDRVRPDGCARRADRGGPR